MKDLPQAPPPREYVKVEGAEAVSRLLIQSMVKRIKSAGCSVDPRLIAESMEKVTTGGMTPRKIGNLVLEQGEQGDLVATLGTAWKVSLSYDGRYSGGQISVFAKEEKATGRTPGRWHSQDLKRGWYSQDLPDGSAAKIAIMSQVQPSGAEPFWSTSARRASGESAYVCRESHMFAGLLWDCSATRPAEIAYYPSGKVYWWHRYQNGVAKGRASLPVFANYWESGQIRILEFGSGQLGKTRRLQEGPAYSEFHPDGRLAAEIYAERKWNESAGCSVLLPGWKARYFDKSGVQTTRQVMLKIKTEGPDLGSPARRDLEDLGEKREEKQLFIIKFTELISQNASVTPRPFFISERENIDQVRLNVCPQSLARGQSSKTISQSVSPAPAVI